MADPADLPARLGRYEVLREVGRGGMGVVYEARDPEAPGRRLAIKLLRSDTAGTEALRRFEREVELLARVRHVNVVAVHTLSWAREGPCLVMDLVEGRSLRGAMLPPAEAARIVRALCGAVGALHAQGVLHRDLKPGNVLLRPDGSPVLLDFGVARDLSAERLTATHEVVGTPRYLAPEALAGRGAVDARTDVHGLGAVLFELLGGEPPYAEVEGGPLALLGALMERDPRWPSSRAPAPPALEAIVRRAMARAPADRFATPAALGQALDVYLRGEAAAAGTGRPAGLALAALAALLLGAFAWHQAEQRPARRRRAAARALDEVLEWDRRALAPHGLGLGAAPAPGPAELEAAIADATSAALAVEAARGPEAEALLARLVAQRRWLAGDRRARAEGPTGALVLAMEARDLDAALVALEAGRGAPEWPLVRAELELRALRDGPRDALRALPRLPTGALAPAEAAALAARKGRALTDPAVAQRWADALSGWVLTGSRGSLEALAALRRLLPATARAAPEAEAAFVAGLRARFAPALGPEPEPMARALALDALLRALAPAAPRWAALDAPALRFVLEHGRGTGEGSAAVVYLALATSDVEAGGVLETASPEALAGVLPEPEQSRAYWFLYRRGTLLEEYERAVRALEAPADDLSPVYVAQAHQHLVGMVVARLQHAGGVEPSAVTRARASAAAVRASARVRWVAATRLAEALRNEVVLRCRTEGWGTARQALAELEADVRSMDRDDETHILVATWRRCADALSMEAHGVSGAAELALELAAKALASGEMNWSDGWQTRAAVVRSLRALGRWDEALAEVRAHDERAWGDWLFAYEAALTLAPFERERALTLLRWALSRPEWARDDTTDLMEKALRDLQRD